MYINERLLGLKQTITNCSAIGISNNQRESNPIYEPMKYRPTSSPSQHDQTMLALPLMIIQSDVPLQQSRQLELQSVPHILLLLDLSPQAGYNFHIATSLQHTHLDHHTRSETCRNNTVPAFTHATQPIQHDEHSRTGRVAVRAVCLERRADVIFSQIHCLLRALQDRGATWVDGPVEVRSRRWGPRWVLFVRCTDLFAELVEHGLYRADSCLRYLLRQRRNHACSA